jgi:hypothetical protein
MSLWVGYEDLLHKQHINLVSFFYIAVVGFRRSIPCKLCVQFTNYRLLVKDRKNPEI